MALYFYASILTLLISYIAAVIDEYFCSNIIQSDVNYNIYKISFKLNIHMPGEPSFGTVQV